MHSHISAHFYNYTRDFDSWDPLSYTATRFASEFGFQSYPTLRSLEAVIPRGEIERGLYSPVFDNRQHLESGEYHIKNLIDRYLVPYNTGSTWSWKRGLEIFAHLTQA